MTESGSSTVMPGRNSARSLFRTPIGPRIFSLLGVMILGAVSAGMAVFSVFTMLLRQWAPALMLAALSAFLMSLTLYVLRDLRGKWGLRVVLGDTLVLDLPAGRSLIHHPPEQHLDIPYGDIAAIETRLEAYRTFGMAMLQRAYALRRRNDELIYLFEDRAIDTPMESAVFPKLAADIAARAGVPLRDLGMAEGGGGILAVWGAHAPDWAAPSLSAARQARLRRHAALTGTFAIVIVIIGLAVRLLAGPL
jgi:hypothetical protein